uniref:PERQ amino acid-rich with GYF domain-containing protein CG11148 n=1 Tax=Zeugodacus cucurbitae TaxID=28588 RepID=A0A0A1WKA3_ZEUCU
MTDSMKFGPEWLRNMSADNTNSSLLSSGGVTGGGNVMTTSSNSNNGGNGGGHQSFGITSSVSSPAITPFSYALAPRNTFPEFRYGREEMLSLFDKNYNMPEILPTFKKIFVEKVQLPLALTPSTDEELLPQVPPVTTQRPSWMQRSPVGFNTSTRGVGRGCSVDRGRMRGKPNYHQIYQRPTAMFGDDDPRSIPVKADRGWPERNGGGDSLNTGGGNMCGIGGISSDWNGTPTSSPRKEFSSHPRNMENWRRNRNEDGSGDAPSGGLGGTEGWRGNSGTGGNFTATHRWGRSTSWRDEDVAAANITDVGYSGGSGHNLTMQRSYSTITTVNERGGYISSSSKAPPNSLNGNQASSRTFNFLSGINTPLARSGQWNSQSGGIGNSSGGDVEDNLPEWAMENPLEGGGTFDASGAFHGSVDDENENIDKQTRKKSDCSSESSARNNGSSVKDSKSSETSTGRTTASLENEHNKSNVSDSSEHSSPCTPIEGLLDLHKEKSLETKTEDIAQKPDTSKHVSPQIQQEQTSDLCSRDVTPTTVASSNSAFYNADNATNKINTNIDGNGNVHRDLSDRMREVTDNMIEKLIMEDDTIDNNVRNEVKQDASPLPVQVTVAPPNAAANNLCAPNVFTSVAAMLKQPTQQSNEGPVSVSPTLTPALTEGLHKGIQLYGGGVVVDHATMQHHHMQQHQLAAAAVANIATVGRPSQNINATTLPAGPTDLWYYRDPQSKVQGPFTAIEMTEWYRAGYFNENLFVRRICDTHFRSLGELIKICNDNMPFTHSHLIPNLDNIHLATSPTVGQTQKPHVSRDYSLKQQTHQQAELQQQQQQQHSVLVTAIYAPAAANVSAFVVK